MPPTPRYAADADITTALGRLGPRLPADVNVPNFGAMAHARALDALRDVYGDDIPDFADDGLEVVRWAEAKLAAAAILRIIRASLGDTAQTVPDALEADAMRELAGGVPGYPVGGAGTTDAPATGLDLGVGVPRHSSATPTSNYLDPYDELRAATDVAGVPLYPEL